MKKACQFPVCDYNEFINYENRSQVIRITVCKGDIIMDTLLVPSPLGEILLTTEEDALTGVWFAGGRYAPAIENIGSQETPVLALGKQWLEIYFSGREPDFLPPLRLKGTPFQEAVWALLREIPYGQTVTYGQLAVRLGKKMSAQAVGGAVGRNPISIIVPCHRVVGADGSLTGYAGGLERKRFLLALERG